MTRWRTSFWRPILAALLLAGAGGVSGAAVDEAKAAQVMAAYLRHIAALTTWPQVVDGERPIVIGVVGADPNSVMAPIRSRVSGEGLLAQGRPIEVVDVPIMDGDPQQLAGMIERCDLMFLTEGTQQEWSRIASLVAPLPIVTVSEMEGFARGGGMVEYFVDLDSGKVRMIVNLEAMKRSGVLLSARLLALESVILLRQEEDV